jgi:formate hydrogenlyase subunit 6/NADH:ubiquinone oxidoreductase subunit I
MFDILKKTLKTGSQTTKYPQIPDAAPAGFRGKPELMSDKCTCCGKCVAVCPPGVIWLTEERGEKILTLSYCGCIFCGRCEEVCPESAVKLTQEYELASKTKEYLLASIRRTI